MARHDQSISTGQLIAVLAGELSPTDPRVAQLLGRAVSNQPDNSFTSQAAHYYHAHPDSALVAVKRFSFTCSQVLTSIDDADSASKVQRLLGDALFAA